jgi:hypothetical protein
VESDADICAFDLPDDVEMPRTPTAGQLATKYGIGLAGQHRNRWRLTPERALGPDGAGPLSR